MFQVKKFNELSLEKLYDILKLRVDVFVVEQNCPYPEVDGIDDQCLHVYTEKNGVITSYCRLIPPGVLYDEPSIGRIIVHPSYRKEKLGRALIDEAIKVSTHQFKRTDIKIHAQVYLYDFYRSFGFEPVTERYLEDDIWHVDMVLSPIENV